MSLILKQTLHALVMTKGFENTREILKWYNLGVAYIINLCNVQKG